MKQPIQLQIPTPCHENWHLMTPVEQGRFCNACAKTVIDFSIMTDQQILDYLSTASAGVCGRVTDTQLSRNIAPVPVPRKTKWWMAFLMPLLIGINRAAAQKKQSLTGKVAVTQPAPAAYKVGELAAPAPVKKIEITGKITDSNGVAVPFALVSIEATAVTVSANSEGVYTITTKAMGDSVTLSAKSLGYITRQYTLTAKAITSLDIMLQPEANDLAPVIVKGFQPGKRICYTGAIRVVKRDTLSAKALDTINRFAHFVAGKPQRFSVAPNPVRRHQQFTLVSKESGSYTIQVLNNSGVVVFVQYYKEAKGVSQYITAQSVWIPGMYYVRMIDEKTKQQYTQKLIVM